MVILPASRNVTPGHWFFQEKTPELIKLKGMQMKQRMTEGSPIEKRENLSRAILTQYR